MKYKIYSIDKSRQRYTDKIHWMLSPPYYHVGTKIVNGYHRDSLDAAINDWGVPIHGQFTVGQLGIWYSFLYALQDAPILTFDDDAILNKDFGSLWNMTMMLMPKDADFFSLFIPRDSDHMWNESFMVSKSISRVYSRYGGVSFYFTERGKENIMKLVRQDGIRAQYDDTLYAYAKEGKLNGYCRPPTQEDLVYITGQEKSIVQESELYGSPNEL